MADLPNIPRNLSFILGLQGLRHGEMQVPRQNERIDYRRVIGKVADEGRCRTTDLVTLNQK
jgi:hypothetical protein